MINPLIMFGGKKGPDMGIGEEFDTDSQHYPIADGSVNVTEAEKAYALIRRPPRPRWSGAFRYRYSVSVWLCPHKWISSRERQPFVSAFVRTDPYGSGKPDRGSEWMIAQDNAGHIDAQSATNSIHIGHADAAAIYGRNFTLSRMKWTHLFVTVDTTQVVAEDRQKVWIDGVFTAGRKGATFWNDLNPQSQDTQYPANPFLDRNYPGGAATYTKDTDPKAENFAMGVGCASPFWNNPTVFPINHESPRVSAGIAALYFIDDDATVGQIAAPDPITNIWTQKPVLPVFGNGSFYLNFKDRGGSTTGANTVIARDQLGTSEAVAYSARQNVSGHRNTFKGKAEAVIGYPKVN
jgi:hypothetical protein